MTSSLVVTVSDLQSVTYFVNEELPVGSVIGNVLDDFGLASRYNSSTLSTISFELLTQPSSGGYVKLVKDSWDIVVSGRIDRESLCAGEGRCLLYYTVAVRPLSMFTLFSVELEVLDINDHSPSFSGHLSCHVTENAVTGSQLVAATVVDRDIGQNGLDRYEMTTYCVSFDPRPVTRRLSGGQVELRLRLEDELDRETQHQCVVAIWAVDGGTPARIGSTRVIIIIGDINDNSPSFDADSYEVWIPEHIDVGTCFLTVSASDNDEGLNAMVMYSLDTLEHWNESPPFVIDSKSGTICLDDTLDFEVQSVFVLSLLAEDLGAESLSGRSTLTVYVEDVNDNRPTIVVDVISGSGTDIEVEENSEEHGLTLALLTVFDLDSDRNGRVVCSLNDTTVFRLVELYQGQYHITSVSALNCEGQDIYSLLIHCHDLGDPSLSSSTVVSVRSVNSTGFSDIFNLLVMT